MSEEIKTSHFKTMKELLEHLKMWERDDDYEAYCRFFDYECAYAMAHYIDKLQKENKEWFDIADDILRATNKYGEISIGEVVDYINKLQKEIERIKSIDIHKLVEDVETGQLIHKNKIREKKNWYQETMKHLCKNGIDLDKYERYSEVVDFCKELLGE